MPLIKSDYRFRILFKYEHGYNYLMEDTAYLIFGAVKYQGVTLFMRRPKEIRIDPDYPISADDEARDLFKQLSFACHPRGTTSYGIDKEDLTKALIGMPGWATGNGNQFRPQRHKWEAEHGWRKFYSTT